MTKQEQLAWLKERQITWKENLTTLRNEQAFNEFITLVEIMNDLDLNIDDYLRDLDYIISVESEKDRFETDIENDKLYPDATSFTIANDAKKSLKELSEFKDQDYLVATIHGYELTTLEDYQEAVNLAYNALLQSV